MIKNILKREPIHFMFKKMWQFLGKRKKTFILYSAFFIISNLVNLLEPLIFAEFLNEIQKNGVGDHNLVYLVIVLLALFLNSLLFWLFHGTARVMENDTAFWIRHAYTNYLLKGILNLGLSWHNDRDSGDTVDKVNKARHGLYRFAGHTYNIYRAVISAIGTTIVIMFFNAGIALGVFLFIVLSIVILFQFDKRLIPQYKELNKHDNDISAKIFDSLSNITSVVILRIKENVHKGIQKATRSPWNIYHKNNVLNEWKWFTASAFFNITLVLPIIVYLIYLVNIGETIEIGSISALYLYLSQLGGVFFTFGYIFEDIMRQKADVENVQVIEDSFIKKEISLSEINKWKDVKINNLNFSYHSEKEKEKVYHLDNVSFEFKRGEKVALVGRSGSGKTTFLKILHGLYDNVQAEICVDGKCLPKVFSEVDFGTMLVPQDPELFSASIKENITFGLDYSNKEIYKYTDLAAFTDVVKDLPKGLKSKINEKGVNLSGGQKQRLALARALLFAESKNMILLDESTSSVDPKTEVSIYKGIFEYFKDKTVIASIHKLNLLKYFDRIVIFENGEIKNQGSFDYLLENDEDFSKMWQDYIKSVE